MIVCVCRRVSDSHINRHVSAGCSSFDDLQMDLGVATCCGACLECAQDVFHHAHRASRAGTDVAELVE
ncbi:MAG: (2Fe-2S)-binding protein [Burkholderiaceae bacterium]